MRIIESWSELARKFLFNPIRVDVVRLLFPRFNRGLPGFEPFKLVVNVNVGVENILAAIPKLIKDPGLMSNLNTIYGRRNLYFKPKLF